LASNLFTNSSTTDCIWPFRRFWPSDFVVRGTIQTSLQENPGPCNCAVLTTRYYGQHEQTLFSLFNKQCADRFSFIRSFGQWWKLSSDANVEWRLSDTNWRWSNSLHTCQNPFTNNCLQLFTDSWRQQNWSQVSLHWCRCLYLWYLYDVSHFPLGKWPCWTPALNIAHIRSHNNDANSCKIQFNKPSVPGAFQTLILCNLQLTVSMDIMYCSGIKSPISTSLGSRRRRSAETSFSSQCP